MGRPTIFLSYSHADEAWRALLEKHLKSLQQDFEFEVWSDQKIAGGEDWRQAIEAAISRATVAILVVSADFLASDFVRTVEVPEIFKRRESQGLRILPVIARSSAWRHLPWLARLQARPQDGRPLASMSDDERENAVAEIASEALFGHRGDANQQARQAESESRATPHPKSRGYLLPVFLLLALLGAIWLASSGTLQNLVGRNPRPIETATSSLPEEGRSPSRSAPEPTSVRVGEPAVAAPPGPPPQPDSRTTDQTIDLCEGEARLLLNGQMSVRLSFHTFDGFEVGTLSIEAPGREAAKLALIGPGPRTFDFDDEGSRHRLAITAVDATRHCARFQLVSQPQTKPELSRKFP